MARFDDHIQRWQHNRTFLGEVGAAYPDWMVTVAFYTAVHAVEALFAFDSVSSSSNHSTRFEVLRRTRRYENIYRLFYPLYQASRIARYQCGPAEWMPLEDVKQQLIPKYLYPLEQSVRKLMNEQFPLFEPIWPN